MSAMSGQPGTGWQVTSQQEETGFGDNARAQDGVRVFFRTQYGATGSVWLPRLSYTPETVRTAITEAAANMDTVHTLTG